MTEELRPTKEEQELLDHVAQMVGYWAGEVEGGGLPPVDAVTRERLDGLAFSLLVMFDGGASVGPFSIRAINDEGLEVGEPFQPCLHEWYAETGRRSSASAEHEVARRIQHGLDEWRAGRLPSPDERDHVRDAAAVLGVELSEDAAQAIADEVYADAGETIQSVEQLAAFVTAKVREAS